jgi:hypothetical protein
MTSVRDYAVLYLGASGKKVGGSLGGGNVSTGTTPHILDGVEHTLAGDSTRLDASTTAHGLLPKLSGDATTFLNGLGAFASLGSLPVWEPMIASDGTVMTDGLLNPMMHEVTY